MNANSELFMRRAIELSRGGFPAPNPHVGCVIVHDGVVIGEGFHTHAGAPHAEVVALSSAGSSARGADLYCTLEPCSHQGRTPPCTDAIIEAGVTRVFVAVRDPNPLAKGGLDRLKTSGVACDSGLLEEDASEANRVFLTAMKRGRPFVVAKAATTSDGFIAKPDGTSKWITGTEARDAGHRLRAELGCVLVGRSTVEMDDPQLTARLPDVVNQPLRVVLDPSAKLGEEKTVFSDGGSSLRFVAPGMSVRAADVEIACDDGFDLQAVLNELFSRGVTGVLVEGGGETISSFLRAGLVDRVERFVSRKSFGEGLHWLGSEPPEFELKEISRETLGDDEHVSYEVVVPRSGT